MRTSIPSFCRLIFRLRASSLSTVGMRRSRASTTVTCEPKPLYTVANSTPITPPPMITKSSKGVPPCSRSSVESITPSSSAPGIGGINGLPPVAIRINLPVTSCDSPSLSVYDTVCSSLTSARPCSRSILAFARPVSMPSRRVSSTSSLRALTASRSTLTSAALTPILAPSLASLASSDERMIVFVGTQPLLRQVPPTLSFSITATFMPYLTASKAAS